MSQGQSSLTISAGTQAASDLMCKTYRKGPSPKLYLSNNSRTVYTRNYKFVDISVESYSEKKESTPVKENNNN